MSYIKNVTKILLPWPPTFDHVVLTPLNFVEINWCILRKVSENSSFNDLQLWSSISNFDKDSFFKGKLIQRRISNIERSKLTINNWQHDRKSRARWVSSVIWLNLVPNICLPKLEKIIEFFLQMLTFWTLKSFKEKSN